MRRLAAAVVLALAAIGPARADDAEFKFCGALLSGTDKTSAETVFTRGADGVFHGRYTFKEAGGDVAGLLSPGSPGAPGEWLFVWHDKYGEGALDVRFSTDMSHFIGKWGPSGKAPSLPWNGGPCPGTS
jgi:hypothetical protein